MAENTGQAAATPAATSATAVTPEQAPLIDALLQVVEQIHRPLAEAEREQLRSAIALGRQASAALMAYPLSNADEPDPIFAAYRAD
ncbi:MAG: hypothetical protein ACYDCQ_08490 [Dehalococcoidia bacterium]